MMQERRKSRTRPKRKRIFRWFLIAACVAIAIVAINCCHLRELLTNTLMWVDNLGYWAPLAFILIYNLATVLFIPGAILTLGGGVIFGLVFGSLYVFIASTLGATSAFLIGRYWSRSWVLEQLEAHPKFKAIDKAVTREGFKIVFLTRLCPLLPFNLLNYAFGVMQLSLRDYFLGSVGMIPGTIMYVYIGSLAGDLASIGASEMPLSPRADAINWAINIMSLIVAAIAIVYITRIASKALEENI